MAESSPSGQELLAKQRGTRNTLVQLVRAIAGLGVSYLVSRWITNAMFELQPVDANQLAIEVVVFLLVAAVALTISNVIPIRRDLELIGIVVDDDERMLREQGRIQRFHRDVHGAFEMAEHETELYDVAAVALAGAGEARSEILVADASRSHVHRSVVAAGREAPGCGVTTPGSCPAVRRGQTLHFAEPNGFASCPRLRERRLPDGAMAACVPITILGQPTAVLHAVYDITGSGHDPRESVTHLEALGANFGTRLGMVRAMSQSRLQADTDPLTGLINRRAMEDRVRELRMDDVPFALAMIDLDHFKDLNDTFGHDTGDRALRLWSRLAINAVRDDDIVARYGGEEFVIVIAGAEITAGAAAVQRLRERLADTLADGNLPVFTFSAGLVDSSWSDDLTSLIASADRALLQAKHEGRDRLVVDDPARPLPRDATADVGAALAVDPV